MIDFEKFGWTPSDETSSEEEETVQEEVVEEPVEEVQHEESHEEYQPVSQKKPGKANIVVVGVGGGGNNAVNNMIRAGIKSASFVVMNTDMQALNMSLVPPHCKIQLGANMTGGLGAGSDPEIGRKAAEESRERIKAALKDIDLLFITAGMGGGTGTGAAPVIAEIAKSMNILTVAVVTKPFNFEGAQRMKNAEEGIKNLKNFVDTLLVIPNQKLIEVLDKNISFKRAFEIADDVLRQGVQGVSDVIANPELINLDFADVSAIMKDAGLAHMGVGRAAGKGKAEDAARTVGLHDAIAALPEGYDTPCTPGIFSQGQWQLLSIARAIAAGPQILLLDEITANLDAGTEQTVLDALQRAGQNRTVVSISHRLYNRTGGRSIEI